MIAWKVGREEVDNGRLIANLYDSHDCWSPSGACSSSRARELSGITWSKQLLNALIPNAAYRVFHSRKCLALPSVLISIDTDVNAARKKSCQVSSVILINLDRHGIQGIEAMFFDCS